MCRTLSVSPSSQRAMTAKQFMNRARHLDGEIDALRESRRSAFETVTRVTQNYNTDGAQSSRNPHKFERLAELEDYIDQKVDEQLRAVHEILETIMEVQDERQRKVLTLYYTVKDSKTGKPLTWEQVAVELHYSWKQTRRIHGKALAAVDKILAERCP